MLVFFKPAPFGLILMPKIDALEAVHILLMGLSIFFFLDATAAFLNARTAFLASPTLGLLETGKLLVGGVPSMILSFYLLLMGVYVLAINTRRSA